MFRVGCFAIPSRSSRVRLFVARTKRRNVDCDRIAKAQVCSDADNDRLAYLRGKATKDSRTPRNVSSDLGVFPTSVERAAYFTSSRAFHRSVELFKYKKPKPKPGTQSNVTLDKEEEEEESDVPHDEDEDEDEEDVGEDSIAEYLHVGDEELPRNYTELQIKLGRPRIEYMAAAAFKIQRGKVEQLWRCNDLKLNKKMVKKLADTAREDDAIDWILSKEDSGRTTVIKRIRVLSASPVWENHERTFRVRVWMTPVRTKERYQ